MATVDRSYFQIKDFLYKNSNKMPVHVGYGYYSETPHIIRKILVILEPYLKRPKSNILEIGTGSGYLTVCMNQLLHENSAILSLEINLKLLNRTIKTVENYYANQGMTLNRKQTMFLWWNGKRGIYSRSPFDVIYCSGLISDEEYNKVR
uniref:protein-L-isoaspartate(D-aspartate) O-methyltransferase n=1 Tax=Cacopsylla melanoneura TaxID=428564 RepID=A0A8D9AUI9_9HEMI